RPAGWRRGRQGRSGNERKQIDDAGLTLSQAKEAARFRCGKRGSGLISAKKPRHRGRFPPSTRPAFSIRQPKVFASPWSDSTAGWQENRRSSRQAEHGAGITGGHQLRPTRRGERLEHDKETPADDRASWVANRSPAKGCFGTTAPDQFAPKRLHHLRA